MGQRVLHGLEVLSLDELSNRGRRARRTGGGADAGGLPHVAEGGDRGKSRQGEASPQGTDAQQGSPAAPSDGVGGAHWSRVQALDVGRRLKVAPHGTARRLRWKVGRVSIACMWFSAGRVRARTPGVLVAGPGAPGDAPWRRRAENSAAAPTSPVLLAAPPTSYDEGLESISIPCARGSGPLGDLVILWRAARTGATDKATARATARRGARVATTGDNNKEVANHEGRHNGCSLAAVGGPLINGHSTGEAAGTSRATARTAALLGKGTAEGDDLGAVVAARVTVGGYPRVRRRRRT